jgi:hypothetical protein
MVVVWCMQQAFLDSFGNADCCMFVFYWHVELMGEVL